MSANVMEPFIDSVINNLKLLERGNIKEDLSNLLKEQIYNDVTELQQVGYGISLHDVIVMILRRNASIVGPISTMIDLSNWSWKNR